MGAERNSNDKSADVIAEIVFIEVLVYVWVKNQTVKMEVQTW